MKAIRILIVEDEKLIAKKLSDDLEKLGIQTIDILARGEDAIDLVKQNVSIDLIIMDIELQGKLNGIQTIQKIHEIQSIPVIILSSKISRNYIEDASNVSIYAFLPKPFNALTIKVSIEMALNLFKKEVDTHLRFQGNVKIAPKDKIFIKDKRQYFKVHKEDIMYVKADKNNCLLFTTDDDKYMFTMSMLKFQDKYHYLSLFKIHKSYLINMDKVAKYNTETGNHFCYLTPHGKVKEIDQKGIELPISRHHWVEFQNQIRS